MLYKYLVWIGSQGRSIKKGSATLQRTDCMALKSQNRDIGFDRQVFLYLFPLSPSPIHFPQRKVANLKIASYLL